MDSLKRKAYTWMRWSEKYTGTDMVYLAKGGFWLTIGQIVSSLSALTLSVAFANFIPKETYGTYKYILSVVGLVGMFSLTGMNLAVTQAIARGLEGTLRKSFLVQLKWSIIPLTISIVGGIYYLVQGNKILALSLLIAGLLNPISDSANTFLAFFGGKKMFGTQVKYNAIFFFFTTIIMLATIFISGKVIWLIFIYFFSRFIINIFLYIKTLRSFTPNDVSDDKTIDYGKHLSLINIPTIIASNVDKILIFHSFGAAQLAIYTFAIALPEQIKGILKNIAVLALPKLSEKTKHDARRAITGKITRFLLLLVTLIVTYVILAPFLYKLLFPQYLESVHYSQIFIISLLFTGLIIMFTNVLQSQIEIKSLYKFNIAGSIIQILILFFMITYCGILGVVWARSIYGLLNLSYLWFLIKKNN